MVERELQNQSPAERVRYTFGIEGEDVNCIYDNGVLWWIVNDLKSAEELCEKLNAYETELLAARERIEGLEEALKICEDALDHVNPLVTAVSLKRQHSQHQPWMVVRRVKRAHAVSRKVLEAGKEKESARNV